MATQALARTSATPASARTIFNPPTPRSILKRPTPLPLSPSPFPFSAKFSAYISPSVKSPHVHFPPSPSLISTYTTHSPNTYDRAPISISPNPLALPAWGDRVYSPTLGGFKPADPLKQVPFVFLRTESPRLTDFEDPRSPPPDPRARKSGKNIRFADLPNTPAREPTELSKALMRYPRSPYPSAPLSPVDFDPEVTEGFALREKATSRRTLSLDEKKSRRQRRIQSNSFTAPFTPIPSPLRRANLSPVAEQRAGSTRPRSAKKPPPPLALGSPKDIADDNITIHITPAIDPATSSVNSDTSSAQLNQAFWQSMSLVGTESTNLQGFQVGTRLMTSCEHSASASAKGALAARQPSTTSLSSSLFPNADADVVSEGLRSADADADAQPQFLFATRDGVLWSPGLPREARPGTTSFASLPAVPAREEGKMHLQASELGSVLSPVKKTAFGLGIRGGKGLASGLRLGIKRISRSVVASPSPNDPTAAFPSFSAALDPIAGDGGAAVPELAALQYPPRVQVVEKHVRKGNGV